VEVARLNLLGELQGEPAHRSVASLKGLIRTAHNLLLRHVTRQTLALGAATPGILDGARREILFSAIDPDTHAVSLSPLFDALDVPIVFENDVHAMAARWLLVNRDSDAETVLLVFLDDGQVGAALLVEGHPVPGCVIGAHELGHTRLNVKTSRCYCGETGCLERIFSSAFIGSRQRLVHLASTFEAGNSRMSEMLDLTGMGLANAVNLLRPHRVVLVGEIVRFKAFTHRLISAMRQRMLAGLARNVQVSVWDQPHVRSAETAAWLALAGLYHKGWTGGNAE
jgi:predicted NBD/HSP70 family sugar kinase